MSDLTALSLYNESYAQAQLAKALQERLLNAIQQERLHNAIQNSFFVIKMKLTGRIIALNQKDFCILLLGIELGLGITIVIAIKYFRQRALKRAEMKEHTLKIIENLRAGQKKRRIEFLYRLLHRYVGNRFSAKQIFETCIKTDAVYEIVNTELRNRIFSLIKSRGVAVIGTKMAFLSLALFMDGKITTIPNVLTLPMFMAEAFINTRDNLEMVVAVGGTTLTAGGIITAFIYSTGALSVLSSMGVGAAIVALTYFFAQDVSSKVLMDDYCNASFRPVHERNKSFLIKDSSPDRVYILGNENLEIYQPIEEKTICEIEDINTETKFIEGSKKNKIFKVFDRFYKKSQPQSNQVAFEEECRTKTKFAKMEESSEFRVNKKFADFDLKDEKLAQLVNVNNQVNNQEDESRPKEDLVPIPKNNLLKGIFGIGIGLRRRKAEDLIKEEFLDDEFKEKQVIMDKYLNEKFKRKEAIMDDKFKKIEARIEQMQKDLIAKEESMNRELEERYSKLEKNIDKMINYIENEKDQRKLFRLYLSLNLSYSYSVSDYNWYWYVYFSSRNFSSTANEKEPFSMPLYIEPSKEVRQPLLLIEPKLQKDQGCDDSQANQISLDKK
jgi:hypothetical protein